MGFVPNCTLMGWLIISIENNTSLFSSTFKFVLGYILLKQKMCLYIQFWKHKLYSEETNVCVKQFDNELGFIFRKPVLRSKTIQKINKIFLLSQSSSLKQSIPLEIGFEELSKTCSHFWFSLGKKIVKKYRWSIKILWPRSNVLGNWQKREIILRKSSREFCKTFRINLASCRSWISSTPPLNLTG